MMPHSIKLAWNQVSAARIRSKHPRDTCDKLGRKTPRVLIWNTPWGEHETSFFGQFSWENDDWPLDSVCGIWFWTEIGWGYDRKKATTSKNCATLVWFHCPRYHWPTTYKKGSGDWTPQTYSPRTIELDHWTLLHTFMRRKGKAGESWRLNHQCLSKSCHI